MIEAVVRRTIELDAPVADVWHLVTDRAERRAWFGADVDLPTTSGATGTVVDDRGGSRHIVIDAIEEEHRLGFTWWPIDEPGAASTVTLTLEAEGDRTRLTVVETPVVRAGGRSCQSMVAGDPWGDRLLGLEVAVLCRRVGVPA